MAQNNQSIPRPLVRTNQWVILLSVIGTWITSLEWILLIPLIAGLSGLFISFNPIMALAKPFLTKPPSSYISEDRQQQQFNQWIATILLTIAFFSFILGFTSIAIISSAMVAAASFIAILGFCIGCYIRYRWSQYRYRKMQKNS